jgi:hypothetical protein
MMRCPDSDEVDEVEATSAFRICPDPVEVDATTGLADVLNRAKWTKWTQRAPSTRGADPGLRGGSGDLPLFSCPVVTPAATGRFKEPNRPAGRTYHELMARSIRRCRADTTSGPEMHWARPYRVVRAT